MTFCSRFLVFPAVAVLAAAAWFAAGGAGAASDAPAEFSETLERPLFSKSRRPFVAPVAVPRPAPQARAEAVLVAAPADAEPRPQLHPSDLVLSGVLQRGERTIALVEQRADGAIAKLQIGMAQVLTSSGESVEVEITHIGRDSLTIFAGAPLVFKLRSPAPRDEITVEHVTAEPSKWAALQKTPAALARKPGGDKAAILMPTAVTPNAGFIVGGVTQ